MIAAPAVFLFLLAYQIDTQNRLENTFSFCSFHVLTRLPERLACRLENTPNKPRESLSPSEGNTSKRAREITLPACLTQLFPSLFPFHPSQNRQTRRNAFEEKGEGGWGYKGRRMELLRTNNASLSDFNRIPMIKLLFKMPLIVNPYRKFNDSFTCAFPSYDLLMSSPQIIL